MATDQEIQAKREAVDVLRQQVAEAKQGKVATEDSANRDAKLASLTSQETELKAQLASLRGSESVSAAPAPTIKAAPAADDNKE